MQSLAAWLCTHPLPQVVLTVSNRDVDTRPVTFASTLHLSTTIECKLWHRHENAERFEPQRKPE